tara:strand:+ start:172 stop:381 length:210 start_codon:yes stop_codon:yes gene_type:complete
MAIIKLERVAAAHAKKIIRVSLDLDAKPNITKNAATDIVDTAIESTKKLKFNVNKMTIIEVIHFENPVK